MGKISSVVSSSSSSSSSSSTFCSSHGKVKFCTFSSVVIFLACCCAFSLIVSFLHGSWLMGKDVHSWNHQLIVSKKTHPAFVEKSQLRLTKNNDTTTSTSTGKKKRLLPSSKRLGHLSCQDYGGPLDLTATEEMVYWQDILEDESYVSPFWDEVNPKFLTFEPDGGGFNNIRMAMETVLCLAVAMGRILVLPPDDKMYLLNKDKDQPQKPFGFQDFFPIAEIQRHVQNGLKIITMQDFLTLHVGKLGFPPPPQNRTQWNGHPDINSLLYPYLRQVGLLSNWDPSNCLAAFPTFANDTFTLNDTFHQILKKPGGFPPPQQFVANPTAVHASVMERWLEQASQRKQLCLYNEDLQKQPLLHFAGKERVAGSSRLLTHFYTFLFLQDWQTDLWMKRFVRDHVRYNDEIQCAAARIVQAIRQHVQHKKKLLPKNGDTEENNDDDDDAPFDAFHVRRGDFQYKSTRVSAQEIYDIAKDQIPQGATVYMATDEVKDKAFFDPLAKHYDLLFLDNFSEQIRGISPNLYGMLDQLVASRSRTFFGCWFSTFTGYINRLRGYHSDLYQLPGFEQGVIDSYYYAQKDKKMRMKEYWPVSGAHYAREFPTAWRNIDHGIETLS